MSRYQLTKTIVMVGMMGAGKTAVGTALARLIDVPFLDSDDEIKRAANMEITELFEEFGEVFFREKESLVLTRLLHGTPCVLSTGGGAFLSHANRQTIANHGVSVWLSADRDLLWARVRHKNTRPLLQVENPKKELFRIFEDRTPIYQKAQVTVAVDPNYSVADTAEKTLEQLLGDPAGIIKERA